MDTYEKISVIISAIVIVLVAIALYLIFETLKSMKETTSAILSLAPMTQTSTTPAVTSIYVVPATPSSATKLSLVVNSDQNNQAVIKLLYDKWVVVVSPKQSQSSSSSTGTYAAQGLMYDVNIAPSQGQYFSAYLSMNPVIDSTSIEIAPPTVINNTTLFLSSSNFTQYAGYPYLIINSSGPFTAYIGFARS